MPGDAHNAPLIRQLLPASAGYYLDGLEERMMRGEAEVAELNQHGEAGQHFDQQLVNSERQDVRFIRKLKKIVLIHFTVFPEETIGLFFV